MIDMVIILTVINTNPPVEGGGMRKDSDERGPLTYGTSSGLICDRSCRLNAVEDKWRFRADHALLSRMWLR
jgi:hypothetical protein